MAALSPLIQNLHLKLIRLENMNFLRKLILISFLFIMPFSSLADQKIITNGKVWTGNDNQKWATTVLIKENRIHAVGNENIITQNPDAEIIDVGGKLVLPGFIDNHTHFMDGANSLVSVQTINATSEEEFTNIIKEYAATMPKDEWMLGGIWDHEAWGGTLPHKNWVDDATQDNPLMLYRTDGHIAFANSRALKLAGVDKNTPDPEGGIIVRDNDGEPTGVLIDNAMYLVSKFYPAPTEEKIDNMFDVGMEEALKNGVTQVHSIDMAVWDNLSIYQRAEAENRLKIRTYYVTHISKRHELAEFIKKNGKGNNFLRFGAVKVMVDGALGSGTAWFHEPFTDEPDNSGFPIWPMEELKVMLKESHDYDFQLVIHGIGDKANDEILNIVEEIGASGHRARIEHAQHLSPTSFNRFKELGVIAAVHPYHVYDDGRFAEKRIGAERLKGTYAFKSLLDSGAMVSFGSDWFVAPLKPLLGIYVATTRHTADGKNPNGWIPQEKISVTDAVKAYTINNAYAGNQENDLGTIEVGKLADMVVLSDNIFEIEPENIKDTKVIMTIIDGQIAYQVK